MNVGFIIQEELCLLDKGGYIEQGLIQTTQVHNMVSGVW